MTNSTSTIGIADKPYLALHIQTGFIGMKQEESGIFNSDKIYRNPSDWEKSLSCSVDLTGGLYGPETPIFSSNKLKQSQGAGIREIQGEIRNDQCHFTTRGFH